MSDSFTQSQILQTTASTWKLCAKVNKCVKELSDMLINACDYIIYQLDFSLARRMYHNHSFKQFRHLPIFQIAPLNTHGIYNLSTIHEGRPHFNVNTMYQGKAPLEHHVPRHITTWTHCTKAHQHNVPGTSPLQHNVPRQITTSTQHQGKPPLENNVHHHVNTMYWRLSTTWTKGTEAAPVVQCVACRCQTVYHTVLRVLYFHLNTMYQDKPHLKHNVPRQITTLTHQSCTKITTWTQCAKAFLSCVLSSGAARCILELKQIIQA